MSFAETRVAESTTDVNETPQPSTADIDSSDTPVTVAMDTPQDHPTMDSTGAVHLWLQYYAHNQSTL